MYLWTCLFFHFLVGCTFLFLIKFEFYVFLFILVLLDNVCCLLYSHRRMRIICCVGSNIWGEEIYIIISLWLFFLKLVRVSPLLLILTEDWGLSCSLPLLLAATLFTCLLLCCYFRSAAGAIFDVFVTWCDFNQGSHSLFYIGKNTYIKPKRAHLMLEVLL